MYIIVFLKKITIRYTSRFKPTCAFIHLANRLLFLYNFTKIKCTRAVIVNKALNARFAGRRFFDEHQWNNY